MMYYVCGLVIASDAPLPEVPPTANADPDVRVRHVFSRDGFPSPSRWFMNWHLPDGQLWLSCAKVVGGYLVRFHELADFFVDTHGGEILCCPEPGIPPHTIRHLLLDQLLPLVISLKGREALHASAVLTREGVVAFTGPAGVGKSTTAASFLRAGCPLVSDDCLVLLDQEGSIAAVPAYPGLRLCDDVMTRLFGAQVARSTVTHYTDKCRVPIEAEGEAFCTTREPLNRIYVIAGPAEADGRTGVVIESLAPRDGLMVLIRAAFRLDITNRTMLRRQLGFLARIVETVPVRRLHFPRDLRLLSFVREAVLTDLKRAEVTAQGHYDS